MDAHIQRRPDPNDPSKEIDDGLYRVDGKFSPRKMRELDRRLGDRYDAARAA